MCGRFALTLPHQSVADIFDVHPSEMLAKRGPRYNICPTQEIEAVFIEDGARRIGAMRWGFIPQWYKAVNGGPLLINARSETIATKPAFAKSARERRCLIPASGFYEWRKIDEKTRQPFWVSPASGANLPLIAFAGVWRDWTGPDGPVRSCAIVTTAASKALSHIHHRAPLAIGSADWGLWLGEEGRGAARLMNPPAEDFWDFHEVDRKVGSNKADGPELMAPLGS